MRMRMRMRTEAQMSLPAHIRLRVMKGTVVQISPRHRVYSEALPHQVLKSVMCLQSELQCQFPAERNQKSSHQRSDYHHPPCLLGLWQKMYLMRRISLDSLQAMIQRAAQVLL